MYCSIDSHDFLQYHGFVIATDAIKPEKCNENVSFY